MMRIPSAAIGTAMRPVPDSELDHRPPGSPCFLQVERHVLDDAGAPGVVELRYRVVTAQKLDSPLMDWEEYASTALRSFADAGTLDELAAAHTAALGRKSELKTALREVRDRETGMTLNAVRVRLEEAFEDRESELERAELDRRLSDDAFDVTVPGDEIAVGQLHPTTQVRRLVEDTFLGLGYEIRYDREVETVEYNFDKLAFEPTHPSRSPRATFFLDDDTVLRTETSPSQIHVDGGEAAADLHGLDRPRATAGTRSTRRTIRSSTSSRGSPSTAALTLADLKGTLLHVMRALFGEDRRVRFRTHFFPFTEPSMEPDVIVRPLRRRRLPRPASTPAGSRWAAPAWSTRACSRTSGSTRRSGRGFAFGVGLERVAQLRHGIAEIRPLWENDLRVLRQFYESSRLLAPRLRRDRHAASRARGPARRSPPPRSTGIEHRGVADVDGNLGLFRVGRVLEAGKHPNADRLQLCQVDVGEGEPRQIVCGAWNFGAGATVAVALPGAVLPDGRKLEQRKLRGELSNGMILAEDEVELGVDHAGIMLLPDEREPGTPLADVLAAHATTSCSLESTGNRPDLLSVYGIAREVAALYDLELAPPPGTDPKQSGGDERRRHPGRGLRGLPALRRPPLPGRRRSGRRRCG